MELNSRFSKTDKSASPFEVFVGDASDFALLHEMYLNFSPKRAAQGLPPEDFDVCCRWIKSLLKIGINFLAWKDNRVIGHAAVVPDADGSKSGEFVIFVDQNFRNLGIGTELASLTIEMCREIAYNSVWLTVETANFIAIRLYGNCGFQCCETDNGERTMILKL